MRAALVSLGSVSSQITADAMRKYFETVDMINLKEIEVTLGKDGGLFYQGKPFPQYDCVFLKGSFRYVYLLRSIASLLEKTTPYLPLKADVFTTAHNKLLTHLALEQCNIPMPKTYIPANSDEAKKTLDKVSYPIVMKFPEGTQGKGVMFADSKSSASSLLDALGALNQPFIIQQYIDTGGTDIRAFVIGEKVVASMQRCAQKEEKRANIHAGGKPQPVILSPEAMRIAVKTAKALNADILGVDILQGPLGPVVIEVNASPGLQGISQISTLDIPDAIAKFLHQQTQEILSRTKQTQVREVLKSIDINAPTADQEIITSLTFRGERIILPNFVSQMTNFKADKEYSVKAQKGKVVIEEFM